jgi:hypothetical protein
MGFFTKILHPFRKTSPFQQSLEESLLLIRNASKSNDYKALVLQTQVMDTQINAHRDTMPTNRLQRDFGQYRLMDQLKTNIARLRAAAKKRYDNRITDEIATLQSLLKQI